jgi:hypothetical protein
MIINTQPIVKKQGGIQPGTTATSTFSSDSEKLHIKWINDIFSTLGPEWTRKRSLPICEGSNQVWESDGGWIYYNDVLVGVAENKWQKNRQNAVERGFRYLAEFEEAHRIFVSCSGPGFAESVNKGSTDAFVIKARNRGMVVLVNVSDEQDFKNQFLTWLNNLI